MKSPRRWSKASGSTKRRVEQFIRQGERAIRRQLNSAVRPQRKGASNAN